MSKFKVKNNNWDIVIIVWKKFDFKKYNYKKGGILCSIIDEGEIQYNIYMPFICQSALIL